MSDATEAVGFNAHLLNATETYRSAGVSEYIRRLLRSFARLNSEFRFTVFAGPSASKLQKAGLLPVADNFHVVQSRLQTARPLTRLVWEQTMLSLYSHRLALLHSPVNVAPALLRTRSVVTVHDLAFLLFDDVHLPAKRRYLRAMTARSVRCANAVITVSDNTRNDVIRLLGADSARVHAIPLAAGEEFSPLDARSADLAARDTSVRDQLQLPRDYFLCLATLEPRKNIGLLLRAYASYRRIAGEPGSLPHLVIAGSKGWMYESLTEQVERLGLRDSVLFTGFVPRESLAACIRGALAFVYLSAYEGFGLPPLEAMACGVPVVVNNVSALPEVVGDAGVLVNANDEEQVASALHNLQTSPEWRIELGERSLAQAARFSWEKTAAQTLGVYRQVLHQ